MLLRAFQGRPLLISYPKSGRTWLRVMLDELRIRTEYSHLEAGLRNRLRAEELVANPLWVAGRPTVLMVRNPLDTLVSSYFQATRRLKIFSGSPGEFLRHPLFGIAKLARWNVLWASQAERHPRFRLISYESLHVDTAAVLAGVVAFYGGRVTPTDVARAVAEGQIDKMREKERAGAFEDRYRSKLQPGDATDPDSFKVRRGVVAGYREVLDESDVRFAEEVLARGAYEDVVGGALRRFGLGPR
jgi:hypothetical protein